METWYTPSYVKGLRLGVEWQHIGSYFVDPKNTARYDGYDVLNCRAGYRFKRMELWMNVLNVANHYYSYITTKSSFGYSYQLAEPRTFHVGMMVDVAEVLKTRK
jgi:outer membrane receptor for ferric coprogen and ferric-rhodotorulic acid